MEKKSLPFNGISTRFLVQGQTVWFEKKPFVGLYGGAPALPSITVGGIEYISRKTALTELAASPISKENKELFIRLQNSFKGELPGNEDNFILREMRIERAALTFLDIEGSKVMSVTIEGKQFFKVRDVLQLVRTKIGISGKDLTEGGRVKIKVEGETLAAWYGTAACVVPLLKRSRNPKAQRMLRYFNGSPAAFPKGAEKLLLMLHDEHTVNRRLMAEACLNTMEEMGFIF